MIRLLIIGGKLQGIEVAYLAEKAGFYTVLVDKNEAAPAALLADRFVREDIYSSDSMLRLYKEADAVIPAIEDVKILRRLMEYGEMTGKKVIFDENCYRISSSKNASNEMFEKLGLPIPGKYPDCSYPVIIKPDSLSGSSQVYKACSREEAEAFLSRIDGAAVIQEYLEGRSFSLEVIGDGIHFYYPQITEVITDEDYDCKRIIAPAQISRELSGQFFEIARRLAVYLKIQGIFDIEVICHNGKLKLLEIDARFPSQTPVSIYHSTGLNMVKMLVSLAAGNCLAAAEITDKVCCYQQLLVREDEIRVVGEHVIGEGGNLRLVKDFFGAEEGITDYEKGKKCWRAIMIVTADSSEGAYEKFLVCIENIKKELKNPTLKFTEG